MAAAVFRKKVHIGYLAAIVAASNAGGSGSVVGDTTTTMMWIDGVSPLAVIDAYVAAIAATLFFGYFAARQQHAYSPIIRRTHRAIRAWTAARLGIVAFILAAAIGANVVANLHFKEVLDHFPVIGAAVWVAILAAAAAAAARLEAAARGARRAATVARLTRQGCRRRGARRSGCVGLFLLGCLLFNFPLLALFNVRATVLRRARALRVPVRRLGAADRAGGGDHGTPGLEATARCSRAG